MRSDRPKRKFKRLLLAADLHGSEITFRKFLAAAKFYDADVLLKRLGRTAGMLPRALGNQDDDLESWHASRTAESAIVLWSATQPSQGRPFARKAPSVDGERQPTRFHRE